MPELILPTVPGYYTLALPGGVTTLAVAPASAPPPSLLLDEPEPRAWGLAAQVYSLRRRPPIPSRRPMASATSAPCATWPSAPARQAPTRWP
ncbi:hypothetical protein WJ966_01995 [Achromobacter xylosoxidans]